MAVSSLSECMFDSGQAEVMRLSFHFTHGLSPVVTLPLASVSLVCFDSEKA